MPCSVCPALVVDNDPDAAGVLQLLLSGWGCETAIALDGAAAVRCVVADPPRLVLVDFDLGDQDGVQVMLALRSAMAPRPRATIVCLTGHSEEAIRLRCLAAGFDAFFTKPMALDILEVLARTAVAAMPRDPAASDDGPDLPP